MKLQPISDDDESGPSDYERMDESGPRDDDCPSAPLLHTTGNIQWPLQRTGIKLHYISYLDWPN